jgi:hypothetical protein
MVLFLLFSSPLTIPATALLLTEWITEADEPDPDRMYLIVRWALVPAIFAFFLMYLGYTALQWIVPYRYTPGGLYLYHLIVDYLVWAAMAAAGARLITGRARGVSTRVRFVLYVIFVGMVFSLLGAADIVMHDGYWTTYALIVRPLARAGLVPLIPTALIVSRRDSYWRLYWLVPPVYVLLAALVAARVEWLQPGSAVLFGIAALVVTAGAVGAAVFWNPGADYAKSAPVKNPAGNDTGSA